MIRNFVSVIIPVRNESSFIDKLLEQLLNQDYDKTKFEIIVIDGLSNDSTKEKLIYFSKFHSNIKIIDNFYKTVPYALNIGIREAKGNIIIRIDAHAEYPSNYISTLVYYLDKLGADNVGASVETLPINDTYMANSIAVAMSSPFGVGNATFRLGSKSSREYVEVDTVPFGCYRREVFDKIGLFDEQLTRNQDNEFNERLRKAGGKIYLIPSLKIKYYARENYSKLYRMFFQYGYFGPLVDIKLKRPTRLRRYVPAAFVIALILPLLLSLYSTIFFFIWLFIVTLYFISNAFFAAIECLKRKEVNLIPYVMWAYFVSHVSYGLGYLKGVYDFLIIKKHLKTNIELELSR